MKNGEWIESFDIRHQKEIEFSQMYVEKFDHGTPGHMHLVVIAQLAGLVNRLYSVAKDQSLELKDK